MAETYFPPPDIRGGWRVPRDENDVRSKTGLSAQKLDEVFEFIQGTTKNGGLLVLRRGWLAFEKYFGKGCRDATPNLASCGKSFTSIGVGILVSERPDLFPEGRWGDQQIVPADFVRHCGQESPYNPHYPYSFQFTVNSTGHFPGLPTDAFWKAGSGGHFIYVVPSLDMVVWKLGGRDDQYSRENTGVPEIASGNPPRDGWQATGELDDMGPETLRRVLEAIVE